MAYSMYSNVMHSISKYCNNISKVFQSLQNSNNSISSKFSKNSKTKFIIKVCLY